MIANIENNENKSKVKIVLTRSFGTHHLLELYSDYVAKKIEDTVRLEQGKENKKRTKK